MAELAFVKFVVKNWRWIVGGLAVVGLVIAVGIVVHRIESHFAEFRQLKTDNATLTAQKAELTTLNQKNQKAFETKLAQSKQATVIAQKERDDANKRADKYRRLANEVLNAPPEDDGEVAKVVTDTVNGIWGPR